jgi:integrase
MAVTINFYLNQNSPKEDKIIFCYVRFAGQTITLHTSERIKPELWDVKAQKQAEGKGKKQLNDYLASYKERVKEIVRELNVSNERLTFELLKKTILERFNPGKKSNFFEVFQTFIDTRKTIVSKATTTKFTTIMNQIKDYANQSNNTISFDSINKTFFDNMNNYFISIGISNNTIRKNFQFIKSFLRWSLEREYHKNIKFENIKNIKETEADTIALTLQEINKIRDCEGLNDRLKHVRDIFLFQFYTGQRYSDIEKFNISDVKDNIWHLRQAKTKKLIEIPLFDQAVKILQSYNNKLPIISNQKMNEYLKELGQIAELNDIVTVTRFVGAEEITKQVKKYELLCTHTARRTFVSIASYNNVNQQVIKAMTGHGSDKMVNQYFKKNNQETLKAIQEIFEN